MAVRLVRLIRFFSMSREEFDLLPWMCERCMLLMAYSPVDHARLPRGGALEKIALQSAVFLRFRLRWLGCLLFRFLRMSLL